jgi:hypothetical protein
LERALDDDGAPNYYTSEAFREKAMHWPSFRRRRPSRRS